MKVEVSFDDLSAYDAKYQPHCFTTYMRNSKFDQTSTMHWYCFELLICESDPPLNEGRALSMTIPLNQFKSILKDNDYNLFDSYLSARLKQHLVKYYSSENCFGEVQGKKHKNPFVYSSSISIPEVLNVAANYKRKLEDRELADEPNDCKSKVLKRAANILTSDIENVEGVTIHPLDPPSISCVVVSEKVPSLLKHFLKIIFVGGFKQRKKVLSIAQDIISLHSNSKKEYLKT